MTQQSTENKKPKIRTKTKYPMPESRISFDNHLEIIKAYVVVSKNGQESVTYKSFKTVVDLHPTIISGNNEFFESIHLIREVEGQRGKYIPTEYAIKLFNALKWRKEEEARTLLKEILVSSWFWSLTKQVLDVKGSATRDEIRDKLGYESNADPKKHNTSLNVLIDYLLYAGLIKEADGNLTFTSPETNSEISNSQQIQLQKPEQKVVESAVEERKVVALPSSNQPQLFLGVLLNPDMSEEQIRKCIRIMMDEWKRLSGNGI